jgi:hypothetical protein
MAYNKLLDPNTNQEVTQAAATPGTEPALPPAISPYAEAAAAFMKALDVLEATIPSPVEEVDPALQPAGAHLAIPLSFLGSAITATAQTPDLLGSGQLDPADGQDTQQLLLSFRPVLNRAVHFAETLKKTLDTRQARLATNALKIYAISKAMLKHRTDQKLHDHVRDMGRDLGRFGRKPKAKAGPPAPPASPAPQTSQQ